MQFHRKERVGSVLHKELNTILLKEPPAENALVTIIEVNASKDLEQAFVDIRVLPKTAEYEALRTLHAKTRRIRHSLLKATRLRHIPRLIFRIADETSLA